MDAGVDIRAVAEALKSASTHQVDLMSRVRRLSSREALQSSITPVPPSYYSAARHSVRCDLCLRPEIVGMRLKCLRCREFNLCEKCGKAKSHPHSEFVEIPMEGEHENVACDECGHSPLAGVRYNCAVCGNFDLCHECKMRSKHSHQSWKVLAPITVLASVYINDGRSVVFVGDQVILTVLLRNHSQTTIEYLSLLPEQGELPFEYYKDFAVHLNPGETNRFIIIGQITRPPGRYSAVIRVYFPEVNEVVGNPLQLEFEVKAKGVFQKVKSMFG